MSLCLSICLFFLVYFVCVDCLFVCLFVSPGNYIFSDRIQYKREEIKTWSMGGWIVINNIIIVMMIIVNHCKHTLNELSLKAKFCICNWNDIVIDADKMFFWCCCFQIEKVLGHGIDGNKKNRHGWFDPNLSILFFNFASM